MEEAASGQTNIIKKRKTIFAKLMSGRSERRDCP